LKRAFILFVLLVGEIFLFTALSGQQFSSGTDIARYFRSYIADLLAQAGPTLVLGFGMSLVLMTSGIDLSVASMVALISCVMSSFPGTQNFWFAALPTGLAVGIVAGALNGFLISRFDVPPIIATLGTMIFYRGLCFVIMGDLEKSPFLEVQGYDFFGQITGASLLVFAVYLIGGGYFNGSAWRREILMIGGNRVAARFAAIPVERRICQVYTLMGLLAFIAALAFTGRNGSVSASSLSGLELRVIVAVVLGGTKVQGGSGSLLGTFFGVLFIAVLDEGLRGAAIWGQQNLPFKVSHLEYLLLGLLLVGGVALNNYLSRKTVKE
jgi:ribose/xylose/arabinose/galactoside ABC-type transport system permease subunit